MIEGGTCDEELCKEAEAKAATQATCIENTCPPTLAPTNETMSTAPTVGRSIGHLAS